MSRLYYGKPDTVEDLLKRLMVLLSEDNNTDRLDQLEMDIKTQELEISALEQHIAKLEEQNESLKKQIKEMKRTVDLLYSAAEPKKEETTFKTDVTKNTKEQKKYNFFN